MNSEKIDRNVLKLKTKYSLAWKRKYYHHRRPRGIKRLNNQDNSSEGCISNQSISSATSISTTLNLQNFHTPQAASYHESAIVNSIIPQNPLHLLPNEDSKNSCKHFFPSSGLHLNDIHTVKNSQKDDHCFFVPITPSHQSNESLTESIGQINLQSQQNIINTTAAAANFYAMKQKPNYGGNNCIAARKKIPSLEHPQPKLTQWLNVFQKWDNAERLLALNEMIKLCEPSQIRQMMLVIEPLFQRDFISLLPKELALYVLWFLPPLDLLRSAQTCRKWRVLAHDNLLWREKCRKLNITPPEPNLHKRFKYHTNTFTNKELASSETFTFNPNINPTNHLLINSFTQNSCVENGGGQSFNWKNVFIREKKIEYNWKRNPITDIKVLKGHDEHVITCLQFDGRIIISGSDDNTLKVWCAVTYKKLATLQGHSGGVWSSEINTSLTRPFQTTTPLSNNTPYTCARCGMPHYWRAANHLTTPTTTTTALIPYSNKFPIELAQIDFSSSSAVTADQSSDNEMPPLKMIPKGPECDIDWENMEILTVVSGSTDRTLKVWEVVIPITTNDLFTASSNTEDEVNLFSPPTLSSNANECLWKCVHTLYGHTSTVRCMSLKGERVVSGSRDATLRLWNIISGECLGVMLGHVAAVRCVAFDGRRVVSGAYDYTVKVWDAETRECLHTLRGHNNRVYSLQFDGVHVVSGSLDTSIRVWDVETGHCIHTLVGHQSLTSRMELKDNILVSGNADSTVKIWNIKTGQCLHTLHGVHKHQSAVTCLQFDRSSSSNAGTVITSSDDGTVKLWDVQTGEFIRDLVKLESGGSGGVVWRIKATPTKLVCAVGSRNGTEDTKLLVLNFDSLQH